MKTKLRITRKVLVSPKNVIDEKCLRIVFFIFEFMFKNIKIQYYALLQHNTFFFQLQGIASACITTAENSGKSMNKHIHFFNSQGIAV